MKEVPLYDLSGNEVGKVTLPEVFNYSVRPDVIRRVYLSQLTARIQQKYRDPLAGLRTSAESWGAGHGVARVPRVKGRGYPKAGNAARAATAVGGVRVMAPRAPRSIWEKVNKKERRLALLSAIAATSVPKLVQARHRVEGIERFPLVVVNDLENLEKTKDVYSLLVSLGLQDELERTKYRFRKIRAGRGKMRGRVRQRARGPLIIYLNEGAPIARAARNIPGVDVVSLRNLSVMHLAPGGVPGRLTIWSNEALSKLMEVVKLVQEI